MPKTIRADYLTFRNGFPGTSPANPESGANLNSAPQAKKTVIPSEARPAASSSSFREENLSSIATTGA